MEKIQEVLVPLALPPTFSLAFSLEVSSIQLNSSKVSTYAVWILRIRSLTWKNWKHGTRDAGMNLLSEAWINIFIKQL